MAKTRNAENKVVVTEDSVSFEEKTLGWKKFLLSAMVFIGVLVADSELSGGLVLTTWLFVFFLAWLSITFFRQKKQAIVCTKDGIEVTVFLRGVAQGVLRYHRRDLCRARYAVISEGDATYNVLGFDYQGKEVKLSPHLSISELDTILSALERFGYDVEWDVAWKMIVDIGQRGWF